jgi:hypothetical protein
MVNTEFVKGETCYLRAKGVYGEVQIQRVYKYMMKVVVVATGETKDVDLPTQKYTKEEFECEQDTKIFLTEANRFLRTYRAVGRGYIKKDLEEFFSEREKEYLAYKENYEKLMERYEKLMARKEAIENKGEHA